MQLNIRSHLSWFSSGKGTLMGAMAIEEYKIVLLLIDEFWIIVIFVLF